MDESEYRDTQELRRQIMLGTYTPARGETRTTARGKTRQMRDAAYQDTQELRRQIMLGTYTPEDSEIRKRVPLSPAVKKAVWKRDRGCCQRCGISDAEAFARDGEHLHFDHIVPFSRNGADTMNNIQLLCGPCNRAKAASLPG